MKAENQVRISPEQAKKEEKVQATSREPEEKQAIRLRRLTGEKALRHQPQCS